MKITKEQRKQQQPQKNKQQLQQMFRNSDIKKYRQTFLQKLKTDLQKCNTKIQQIKNDIREKLENDGIINDEADLLTKLYNNKTIL